ncbi:unnamed protein product [Sphenostylis stenocarpa]|uniref:Uncharacterized protein n=1 Tax=Sphenostylis stenocarpa TaxID=92480 RepID=A0AA86VED7_9FABA|nr:unnamed protein product [Sphenostylis stenocarpa]
MYAREGCRYHSREGVTWGWVRDPERGRRGERGKKRRKRGEWGHVLSFLNSPVVYGSFKSESDPRRETLLSHDVPHSRASLSLSFTYANMHGPTSARTSRLQKAAALVEATFVSIVKQHPPDVFSAFMIRYALHDEYCAYLNGYLKNQ